MTTQERLIVVHPDASTLAEVTAARLLTQVLDLQSVQNPVHLVLTGGTVGIQTLAAVASNPVRDAVDWTGVHIWWGDERFLPDGDADRNETQARNALLKHLTSLPAENVHAMPSARPDDAGYSPEDAAVDYAGELEKFAADGSAVPHFDVLMLGMGPDAHIASLFPGHEALSVTGQATVGVQGSPKPPPLRVSLTFDAIRSAKQVWIIAAGAEKADAVAAGLADAPIAEAPVTGAQGRKRTLWLVDLAAAGDMER